MKDSSWHHYDHALTYRRALGLKYSPRTVDGAIVDIGRLHEVIKTLREELRQVELAIQRVESIADRFSASAATAVKKKASSL